MAQDRYDPYREGSPLRKMQDKQINPATTGLGMAKKFASGLVPPVVKSAVSGVTGFVADANRKQNQTLQGMREKPVIAKNASLNRGANDLSAVRNLNAEDSLQGRERADASLPDATLTGSGKDGEGRAMTGAGDAEVMVQPAMDVINANKEQDKQNTVYTNLGGGADTLAGGAGNINRMAPSTTPSQRPTPRPPGMSGNYEITDSSWTPDEAERFGRKPVGGRPARIRTGFNQPPRFSQDNSNEITADKIRNMKGLDNNQKEALLFSFMRNKMKNNNSQTIEEMKQTGATGRTAMGTDSAESIASARNKNTLANTALSGVNRSNQIAQQGNLDTEANRVKNEFATNTNAIENENSVTRDNANNAMKAYLSGAEIPDVARIRNGNVDFSKMNKFDVNAKNRTGQFDQGDAVKELNSVSEEFANSMGLDPAYKGMSAQEKQGAFYKYLVDTNRLDLYNMMRNRAGLQR